MENRYGILKKKETMTTVSVSYDEYNFWQLDQ